MSLEHIARNASFLFVARVAEKLTRALILVFVARALAVDLFGSYSVALYFAFFGSILFDFGLQPHLIREIASHPEHAASHYANGLVAKVLYALPSLGLTALALSWLGYDSTTTRCVSVLLISRFLASFGQYNRGVFRGLGRTEYETLSALIEAGVLWAGTLLALAQNSSVLTLCLAWLWSSLAHAGFSFYLVHRAGFSLRACRETLRLSQVRAASKEAFWFGLGAVFTVVYFYLNTVILSKLDSLRAVALYTAAHNVALALLLIPQVLVDACFPLASRHAATEDAALDRLVLRLTRYLLLVALPVGMTGAILAGPIIRFLYGIRYTRMEPEGGAEAALAILIWHAGLAFFTYLFGNLLGAVRRQRWVTLSTGIGALASVGLSFTLVPRYSFVGAAVATVVSEAIVLTFFLGPLLRRFSFGSLRTLGVQLLLAALVMGGVEWALREEVPLALVLTAGALVYLLALVSLGGVRREDFEAVRNAWSSAG